MSVKNAPTDTTHREAGGVMSDKLRDADGEPLPLVTILNIKGLDDALSALQHVDDKAKVRRYRVWCARQVLHLMTDPRLLAALDVAERYADGQVTDDDLSAAWIAAYDASSVAVMPAERAAARAAASAASSNVATDAAWDAAWAAASDATWVTARAAGFSEERAARASAAWASAWVASSDVELVAASDAAWVAARAAQEAQFRIMFGDATIQALEV